GPAGGPTRRWAAASCLSPHAAAGPRTGAGGPRRWPPVARRGRRQPLWGAPRAPPNDVAGRHCRRASGHPVAGRLDPPPPEPASPWAVLLGGGPAPARAGAPPRAASGRLDRGRTPLP